MSWDAFVAVMDGSHAKGVDYAVAMAIAKSATVESRWRCYLSLEEIAERARTTVRSARRSTRSLERLGEIHCVIQAGRNGVNLYTLEAGRLMRCAFERYPDRMKGYRIGPDGLPFKFNPDNPSAPPDNMSSPRSLRPGGADNTSVPPDNTSVPPDVLSPGEILEVLDGEREGSAAAEPPPRKEVGAVAPPHGPVGPVGVSVVRDPQDVPWDERLATSALWERSVTVAGCSTFNGQAMQWAQVATAIGCQTLEEAEWMVRVHVKLAKKQGIKRANDFKPWSFSEIAGLRDDVSKLLKERRLMSIIKPNEVSHVG